MPSSMTPTTNLHNDVYKRDGDMKSRANNFHYHHHREIINETKITNNNKNSSGRNKERETHHRYSYDLSSSSTPITKTTPHNNTANGFNRPIITNKQKTKTHSPSSNKDSKYIDYENLIKQFEKLKEKAEFFADKDPEFATKLINLANKITKQTKSQPNKMDSQYYPSSYYQQPNIYSSHSNYPSNNIYSTFNSNNFSHFHYNSSQHHHNPPSNPPPPPPPRPPPIPPHAHRNPANSKFSSAETSNYKYSNTNYSRYSYDNSQIPNNHFPRQSTPTATSQTSNFDHVYSQFFNFNYPSNENPFSYSYSFAQEKPEDLLLILEDPYDSSKITVQLTRTQLGPNGEQQRVTVERDFKSEAELNKFLKEFEENLNKTSSIPSQTKSPSYSNIFASPTNEESENLLKPGVVVVEEPGEEPKLYRQDTGELVTNDNFVDPLLKEENNEHPNEIPKQKQEQTPKYYKDKEDTNKVKAQQKIDSTNKDSEKTCVFSYSTTTQNDSSRDLINFDDDLITEPLNIKSEPKLPASVEKKNETFRRPVRRTESFAVPKAQTLSAKTCMTNKELNNNKSRHRSSSSTPTKQANLDKLPVIPELLKKTSTSAEPSRNPISANDLNNRDKSKVKVINMNKNCKRTTSLSENLNNIQSSRLPKPTVSKGKENIIDQEKNTGSQPSCQFKHQYDKPLLPNHARLGGESSILKRHSSLYSKVSLPKSGSNIECEEKISQNSNKTENLSGERSKKTTEIKSRFSLRETRPNYKDSNRRYSQIYPKDSESDISTIHEEKDFTTSASVSQSRKLEEKKNKFIKNHKLMMSKKISKSVDTGLSESFSSKSSKYMKMNKLEEKLKHKNRGENFRNTSIREEFNDETESEEYETGDIVYDHEMAFKSSTKNLNYDFYNYYGYYNNQTPPPTAYFQANYFPTKSRIQETDLNSTIQNTTQAQQSSQQANPQAHYYQGYYASWYGSAPSLRIPQQRIDNCQSLFFN